MFMALHILKFVDDEFRQGTGEAQRYGGFL